MNKTHLISKTEMMMLKMKKNHSRRMMRFKQLILFGNLSKRLEHHPFHKKSQKSRYSSEDEKL